MSHARCMNEDPCVAGWYWSDGSKNNDERRFHSSRFARDVEGPRISTSRSDARYGRTCNCNAARLTVVNFIEYSEYSAKWIFESRHQWSHGSDYRDEQLLSSALQLIHRERFAANLSALRGVLRLTGEGAPVNSFISRNLERANHIALRSIAASNSDGYCPLSLVSVYISSNHCFQVTIDFCKQTRLEEILCSRRDLPWEHSRI